uniref:Superkiller viralicidic activity 2-like 2 n=1 Tax=Haemonchus contortus TaxID=6289 RepID=A0A7I4Y978_HAECO|nr:DNA RNA helicase and DSH domain containing protein [Haemonchus contortus]
MDVDDLFGAFESVGNGGETSSAAVTHMDKMTSLDAARQEEARKQAANLLNAMLQGECGDSVEPAQKKVRLDDDTVMEELRETFEKRIVVHTIRTDNENCTHEVALPPDTPFEPLTVRETAPAKSYPFQLDAFQREAIMCIENSQSVLVSAHTSAGKTVVALYAIAQCLRDKQRVIYTSPIKALSNQKYRELEEEFGDVGLMTGDVTLNPDASCLVMTTEILRSMLYRGAEVMREVGWVIFDEIHYMRDKERGVVWEETIILLPDNVHHAFLSATIPNARQFAQWVCLLHRQPVHVVYTDYRPTPLQHFIFPVGGEGLYEVVNIQGQFREDKFMQAMSGLAAVGDKAAGGVQRGRKGGMKTDSNVVKIIRTVKERDMLPCIIFSFSRKECEAYALSLKDMDFNDDEEKKLVREIYSSAIDLLGDEDRKLPQIGQILPLLLRGIGVHHSGLLPILKETVEILFGEGLLKTLFATETFSMGLNMPARTVLFTSARKFDGVDNRWITSGEYIQMSGRAGRRGKDDRGLVILMVDHKMSSEDAKQIIKGATDPLNSQFRLTYNMVLNLLRVEGVNPEFMLERSFYQFQNYDAIPELQRKVDEKMKEIDNMRVEREREISAYFDMDKQIANLKTTIKKTICMPKYLVPFLHAGRMIHVVAGTRDFGWGVLINFHKKVNVDDNTQMVYILDVFMGFKNDGFEENVGLTRLQPATEDAPASWETVPIALDCVEEISAVRLKLPQKLDSTHSKGVVQQMVKSVLSRFNKNVPLLHPVKDMRISEPALVNAVEKIADLEQRSQEHPLRKLKEFEDIKKQWLAKDQAKKEHRNLREELRKAQSVLHMEELGQRKRLLRRLQYADNSDIITDKGRCACELSASDELMLTEMLYAGVFSDLTSAQVAALLSCFVFEENAKTPKLAEELSGCLRKLHEHARRIAKLSIECKLEIVEDEYVESFKPGMMDVVFQWANGASFGEVMKNTDIFEGSIIRCLRRLEEVLREMVNAAKSMQNQALEEKFEDARVRIKRDIVFAASLYL